jgi:hypothetical protein
VIWPLREQYSGAASMKSFNPASVSASLSCAEHGMDMLVLNNEQLSPDKALKQDIGK